MAKSKKKYSDLTIIEKNLIKKKLGITKVQDIDTAILKQLKDKLKKIKDTRYKNMITYKLWDVIMCVILASLAQNDTCEETHDFSKIEFSNSDLILVNFSIFFVKDNFEELIEKNIKKYKCKRIFRRKFFRKRR